MTGHGPPPFVHEIMPGLVTPNHDHDPRRLFGWCFGYPECCVEAWIERQAPPPGFGEWSDAAWAAEQLGDQPPPRPALPSDQPRPQHPVSGHRLCEACAAGPMAPLPWRPARTLTAVNFSDDGEPVFYEPSDYDGPRVEQLALDTTPRGL